jgi:peroxiredoxin
MSGGIRAIGFGALLAIGIAWLAVSAKPGPPPADVGAPAPAFTLPDLEGREHSLAEARGKVVLINFWATWCKPCEDEMPAMERLYQELAPAGFELIAVSVDEGREEVVEFQDRMGLSFAILHDPEKQAADRYQSFRYPESFLVDREGTLVARFIGPREWDAAAYRNRVQRLVEAEF